MLCPSCHTHRSPTDTQGPQTQSGPGCPLLVVLHLLTGKMRRTDESGTSFVGGSRAGVAELRVHVGLQGHLGTHPCCSSSLPPPGGSGQAQGQSVIQRWTAPPGLSPRVCSPDRETAVPRVLTPFQEAPGLNAERVSSLQGLHSVIPTASASGDVLLQFLPQEACVVRNLPSGPPRTQRFVPLAGAPRQAQPSLLQPDTTGPLSSLGIECRAGLRVPGDARVSAEAEAHGAPGDAAPGQTPPAMAFEVVPDTQHPHPGARSSGQGPRGEGREGRTATVSG